MQFSEEWARVIREREAAMTPEDRAYWKKHDEEVEAERRRRYGPWDLGPQPPPPDEPIERPEPPYDEQERWR